MTSWSSDWMPAARTSLVTLRGQGATDDRGLPVPALSVIDATATLAKLAPNIIAQLNRLRIPGMECAGATYFVDQDGRWTGGGTDVADTIPAARYLAGFPPPPATNSDAWYRSELDYMGGYASLVASGVLSQDDAATRVVQAWSDAYAGRQDATANSDGRSGTARGTIYTLYTPNQYDDTGGQLSEMRQMVAEYQRACDAIAAGAATQPDMSTPMSSAALLAYWSALGQLAASLDTLADVPPRPPTSEVLQQALDDAGHAIGEAIAKGANVAGEVVGNAVGGLLDGIGVYGLAVIVGVLVIGIALR